MTKEGKSASIKWVQSETNCHKDMIHNVYYEDGKRGLLQRDAAGWARLTPAGFDFLRQLNSPVAND